MISSEKYDKFYNELISSISGIVLKDEPLKKHTYFKIGGPADIYIEPKDLDELKRVLEIVKKSSIPFYIIGNGTNLLVSDDGFRGAIIKIGNNFNNIKIDGETVVVGAGTLLSTLSKETAKKGLTGLEFASGIPGYIGGAIAMNAGAYNGEIKDVVTEVLCIDTDGNLYDLSNEDMRFGYRESKVTTDDLIVISAVLELKYGDQEKIDARIKDLNERRTTKQPLNFPSAGSTFKRPVDGYAAKLIEDAGLKGLIHGGAMVSDKHSGFIINYDNATCKDVIELMDIVESVVKEKFNITLEPEVKIIGENIR